MTTEQLAHVTARTIEGATTREIGAEIGMSHVSVMRAQHQQGLRQIIDEVRTGFVAANARRAAGNLTQIIHSANSKDKELRLKYSAEVARAMGVLPSQAASVVITNIYNDNRTQEIPPEILRLMGAQREQVIDAEYEDVDR